MLFSKKETLARVFSCEFCEISKNTFFTEHPGGWSSFHIAINSSLSSTLFDFADILILKNIKIFQSLVFLLCNISTFLKKRVQILQVSVKLVITIA